MALDKPPPPDQGGDDGGDRSPPVEPDDGQSRAEARHEARQDVLDALREVRDQKDEQRLSELKDEGHGPQRHVDPSDDQLRARLGRPVIDETTGNPKLRADGHVRAEEQVDPMTGTTEDGVDGGVHRCGPFATRFDEARDYVRADEYLRDRFGTEGDVQGRVPIEDVLGPAGHTRMTGFYTDPQTLEHKPVDFSGGSIFAMYDRDDTGAPKLFTMYPDPAPFNPSKPKEQQ